VLEPLVACFNQPIPIASCGMLGFDQEQIWTAGGMRHEKN
jgi:hypothetical protein